MTKTRVGSRSCHGRIARDSKLPRNQKERAGGEGGGGLTRGTALRGYLGLRAWVSVLGLCYLFARENTHRKDDVPIPATSQATHSARTTGHVLSIIGSPVAQSSTGSREKRVTHDDGKEIPEGWKRASNVFSHRNEVGRKLVTYQTRSNMTSRISVQDTGTNQHSTPTQVSRN